MVKKHWLKLGAVAVALLLIPRRSSRQAQNTPQSDDGVADNKDNPIKPLDKTLNTEKPNV